MTGNIESRGWAENTAKAPSRAWRVRPGGAVLFCLCLLLAGMVLRLELDARHYLARGDDFMRRGQAAEAFFCWKMAILSYVPFSSTTTAAADRLETAGEGAIRRGDAEEAERVFRYARSGLLALRHLWQPMPGRVANVEERLTAMAAPGEREKVAERLRIRHGTRRAGLPFLLAGMLGWPLSFRHLLRSREKEGVSLRRRAAWLAAASFACLVLGVVLS